MTLGDTDLGLQSTGDLQAKPALHPGTRPTGLLVTGQMCQPNYTSQRYQVPLGRASLSQSLH